MRRVCILCLLWAMLCPLWAQVSVYEHAVDGAIPLVDKAAAPIMVSKADGITIRRVADLWAADVHMVTGQKPQVVTTTKPKEKNVVVMGTVSDNAFIAQMAREGRLDISALEGGWEQYVIKTIDNPAKGIERALVIAGSDRRGVAYGAFAVSEEMGVSPWYWWADVPVRQQPTVYISANMVSKRPSVKYRGFFINDEDWGLKPWSTINFEKSLGDIGPKTYAKVCELILRLKGNMVAPAMHTCTGAFYSHPESKLVADTFGIIITTSHCEPLLLNNAAPSEWDQKRDGDWNYKTNRSTIRQKWEDRLKDASRFENIYTTAMRGLHDAGLRGDLPMQEKVPLIEQVIRDQREMLSRHKGQKAEDIPQIFVPYKETMDIYENGLRVPDDITLVWVDDNYGYMKRVSNPEEQKRSGGSGVYYHLSYLGAPHDYLWICTTPPVLMYEELKKSYDTGADRYWLLNVGDIKPMELGIQTFFDMAWDINAFDHRRANRHQAEFLGKSFGLKYHNDFQTILDRYYQLAWSRKPEYMGWEREWDAPEYTGMKDTEYSFENYNEAQQRLEDYKLLSDRVDAILKDLDDSLRTAFFEMLAYPVKGAYQMNRKFLMAQLNHEMLAKGRYAEANWAARQAGVAYDSIQALTKYYNTMIGGKWNGMMDLAPGWVALYQKMPEVTYTNGRGEKVVDLTCDPKKEWSENCYVVDIRNYKPFCVDNHQICLIEGMGYDWQVLQLGRPTEQVEDASDKNGTRAEYQLPKIDADSVNVVVYTVPFFPIYKGRSTAIGVSIDGKEPQVYCNNFSEYSKEWKDQVLQNGDVETFRFAIDRTCTSHKLSFILGDPGMMLQKVIIDWGCQKKSYLGPRK